MTTPTRPALSGPGSSAAAWRTYAAALTRSDESSWLDLSRDDIIAELQEQGLLDDQMNPVAVGPGDLDSPDPKGESVVDAADPRVSTESTSKDAQESSTGLVTEPCKICYPGGWPTKQAGQSASCFHGLSIIYGQEVEITRDAAILMGFIKDGD